MSKQVYKIADGCLVVLQIPADAKTNENRNFVKHKKTAKFRCNKAYVLSIMSLKTGTFQTSVRSLYSYGFIYKVGEFVEELYYDDDGDIVCTTGIHYYLTSLGAYIHYMRPACFGEDGTVYSVSNKKNGKKNHKKTIKTYKKEFAKKLKRLSKLQYSLSCTIDTASDITSNLDFYYKYDPYLDFDIHI